MGARERLLLRCGDRFALVGGALPVLGLDVELQDSIAPVCTAATSVAGAPGVLTLRLLEDAGNLNVFDCERAPAIADWRPLEEIDSHLGHHELEALRSGGGAPWYAADFHTGLLDFARRALETRGVELSAPEQVRVSPLSCIYRFAGGAYWLKATRSQAFVPEGAVMRALHAAFPLLVPCPLAAEGDVTLFADFGTRMEQSTPHEVVGRAAAALARMQLEADPLLGTPGLQSWRLADLRADLEASRPALGEAAGEFLDQVEQASADLAAFGIGDHLVHGDFYWGNIALERGEPRIFDWSDAGIGHPFFDPLEGFANPDLERRKAVIEAYLSVWREALDVDVDAAWAIARRIGPAHHLARNTRLLSYLEPWERPTCEPYHAFWARLARESLQGDGR
jgi:hypothetical protein